MSVFYNIESLHLLEKYLAGSAWIRYLNTFEVTILHTFVFNSFAFFAFSMIVSVLYQKKANFFRYSLTSLIFSLFTFGPVFAIHILRPATFAYHIENLFVVYPPYFIFLLYMLCTYSLKIEKSLSVILTIKLYAVMLSNIIVYYMAEILFFHLLSNDPAYMYVVFFAADFCTFVCNLSAMLIATFLFRRHKLWLDAYKLKRTFSRSNIPRRLLRYTGYATCLYALNAIVIELASGLSNTLFAYLILIMLTLIGLLAFYISYQNDRMQISKIDLNNQTLYVRSLMDSIDGFRVVKHDINNMIQAYEGYIQAEAWDKLRVYHQKKFWEIKHASNLLSLNMNLTGNPALLALISEKIAAAKAEGIIINTTFAIDTSDILMDPEDLAAVIGILLDNAIEETAGTDSKTILFSLKIAPDNKALLCISNPTANDVDVRKIMEQNYTTKEGRYGMGLNSLWGLIHGTPGCRLKVEYLGNIITFFIEFPISS